MSAALQLLRNTLTGKWTGKYKDAAVKWGCWLATRRTLSEVPEWKRRYGHVLCSWVRVHSKRIMLPCFAHLGSRLSPSQLLGKVLQH